MPVMKSGLAALLVLIPLGAAHASTGGQGAQPLSIKELHGLYSGKTWQWPDGGGYFAPGGAFVAYTGQGQKAAVMKGGWGAYSDGRICFWGTWKSAADKTRKATCFRHASNGAAVYQQRSDSDWYVFRNAPAGSGDPVNMIVPGDQVSSKIASTRYTVASKNGTSRKYK